jgi:hypothetical protein
VTALGRSALRGRARDLPSPLCACAPRTNASLTPTAVHSREDRGAALSSSGQDGALSRLKLGFESRQGHPLTWSAVSALSADGKSVLFNNGGQNLSLADVATGALTQVTHGPPYEFYVHSVDWAP